MEETMPESYTNRLNIEFQKAGVRGLTLLFASGDSGIASEYYNTPHDPLACSISHPEFPTSSPYVLSVGATQLSDHNAPICDRRWRGVSVACSEAREVVCSARIGGVITSGGGFSRRFERPAYQDKAVHHYIHKSGASFPESKNFYNEKGRGYPDVAVYGTKYVVIMDGDILPTAGTSASTPLMASMVTLWNDIRLSNNQPPLGFINPLLYYYAQHYPETFNDVVYGDNKCMVKDQMCCNNGFSAVPGWDAVTGLGSPNFVNIANLLQHAPTNLFQRTMATQFSYLSPRTFTAQDVSVLLNPSSLFSSSHAQLPWFSIILGIISLIGLIIMTSLFIRQKRLYAKSIGVNNNTFHHRVVPASMSESSPLLP